MNRKSLQHLPEQLYFEIFRLALCFMVGDGRLPGSNASSNVFWVNKVLSTRIFGLPPLPMRFSPSASSFPEDRLMPNKNDNPNCKVVIKIYYIPAKKYT